MMTNVSTVSGRPAGTLLVWTLRIAVGIAFLAVWQIAVDREWIDAFFVSTPTAVATFFKTYVLSGQLWHHALVTLEETFLGFVIGSALGVIAGLMLARFELLSAVASPYLTALNALPRVALAPMFILWFGIGEASKVYLAISLVFFIVMISTEAGIKSIEPDLLITATVMGANQRQTFLKVVLPGSVPSVFAGLRLGAVYSLLGVVVGEMLAAKAGLGQEISRYSGTFATAGVIAVLIALAVIALLLNELTIRIERHLLSWQRP
jgi:NitT/TauT family transport system permease protein